MFVGFALPHRPHWHTLAEKSLGYLVYVILIIIGIELGSVENLHHELTNIALYLATLMVLTLGVGLIPLTIMDFIHHKRTTHATHVDKQPIPLTGSLIQLGCLAVGFVIAKYLQITPPRTHHHRPTHGVAVFGGDLLKRLWRQPQTSPPKHTRTQNQYCIHLIYPAWWGDVCDDFYRRNTHAGARSRLWLWLVFAVRDDYDGRLWGGVGKRGTFERLGA